MSTAAYNVGALIATMGLDTTQFNAGMASVKASTTAAAAATQTASARMTASMAAAGVKMQAIGKKMQRYLTLPILAIGVASTKVFSDFESSMAKITGLVGVAKRQVDEWKGAVLALGPATGQGPEKLAEALFFITSAGIRGAEAMEVLEMAAKAATSGLGEAKVVADLVTSAMNAYGKENLNAAQATDILVATVREGKAEASSLAMAMGMVLPIASEYGVTFDQVGAAFAGMTRTGTNARVAATQLKAILSSMASPALKAEGAMQKYGTSSAQFRKEIEEQGLIQALGNLKKAVNGNKTAMAEIFPNIRGLMGVLDLLGKNAAQNEAIFESLTNSTGALDAAFASASDTTKFRFQKAFATLKTRAIEYGTTLSGFLIPLIEQVTDFIAKASERWNTMSDAQKKNQIRVVALTAAMGPLLSITGRLMKLMATPKGPYMMAIAGALALTLAIRRLVMQHREQKEVYDALATVNNKIEAQYESQAGKIAYLVAVIEDENISNQGRIAAIKELKTIMPGYKGMLTDEGTLIDHNKTSIEGYLVKLREKIRLMAFESEYTAVVKKQVQAQRDLDKAITANRIAKEKYIEAGMVEKKEVGKYVPMHAKAIKVYTEEYTAVQDSKTVLEERKAALDAVNQSQADLTEEMKRSNLVLPGADGVPVVPGVPVVVDDGGAALDMAKRKAQAKLDLIRMMEDEALELYINSFQKKAAAEQLSFDRSKAALEQQGADSLLTEDQVNAGIEALEVSHQIRMERIAKEGADAVTKAQLDAELKRQAKQKEIDAEDAKAAQLKVAKAQIVHDKKMEQVYAYFEAASRLTSALSNLTTMSMDKELEAAGNNKKERERIQRAYYQKQKKWAIAQALINGALAVTIALGTVSPPASYALAIVSGIAAAAEIATIASQNFAQGAVVYGPTTANIGEYPGARHDPEIVSPLSKLQQIIEPARGTRTKEIILRAEGRDLVATIDAELLVQNTY